MNTPCPWNEKFLRASPFYKKGRTDQDILKLAKDVEKTYLSGDKIAFTYVSSLKSMARVPRADGLYKLGRKYLDLLVS